MSKRKPSSDELYKEALNRYRELQPLAGSELDSLLRWASEKHLDQKGEPGEATMLAIRLLLAGRAESLISAPKEGHAEARLRELTTS